LTFESILEHALHRPVWRADVRVGRTTGADDERANGETTTHSWDDDGTAVRETSRKA
jgi:hypothetical protein